MNLHALAVGAVSAINPQRPASLQVSAGWTTTPTAKRVPVYQTPGAFAGSISATVLAVVSVSAGVPAVGQTVSGAGVAAGTQIVAPISTNPDGTGTWSVSLPQEVAQTAMTTAALISAQVQALTNKDLRQIEGLNLNGLSHAMYLFGDVQGVVRADNKGGDLVTMLDDGTVWLVNLVLENWSPNDGWCKVAVTRQLAP